MMERDRLWFFPFSRSNSSDEAAQLALDEAPSFVALLQGCSLDTERSVRAVQSSEVTFGRGGVTTAGGGAVFTISVNASAPITTTALAMSDTAVVVTLKAASAEQAKRWVQQALALHALKPVATSSVSATVTTNVGTTVVTKYRTTPPSQLPLHVLRRRRMRIFLEKYSERKLSVADVALTVLQGESLDSGLVSSSSNAATAADGGGVGRREALKNVGSHNAAEKLYSQISGAHTILAISDFAEDGPWTVGASSSSSSGGSSSSSSGGDVATPSESNCNDVIVGIERDVARSECELQFRRHVKYLETAVTLEGMLCNR